jgi:hypothetical protein
MQQSRPDTSHADYDIGTWRRLLVPIRSECPQLKWAVRQVGSSRRSRVLVIHSRHDTKHKLTDRLPRSRVQCVHQKVRKGLRGGLCSFSARQDGMEFDHAHVPVGEYPDKRAFG